VPLTKKAAGVIWCRTIRAVLRYIFACWRFMLACWLTCLYFNILSNNVNKKTAKKQIFLAALFYIEIRTISPIISLKRTEFLLLTRGFWVRTNSPWGRAGIAGLAFLCRILGVELGNKRKYELWHDEKTTKY